MTEWELDVNVKADLSPDDLAQACADAMWKEDDASSGLGMKIVEIGAGRATLTMTVQPHMVNGQRVAHGGFIFALADSAFAFACNSHNQKSIAASSAAPSRPDGCRRLPASKPSARAVTARPTSITMSRSCIAKSM